MNKRIEEAEKVKIQLRDLKTRLSNFFIKLAAIDWKELKIEKEANGNSLNYTVSLGDELSSEFEEIKDSIDTDSEYSELFHHLIWEHPENSFDETEWSIDIKLIENNRIHIAGNGLPFSFRGKGLGKKIYKRIIQEVGYISTKNYKAYTYSHLLWESLIRDTECFCFISDDEIIAVLKNNIPKCLYLVLEKSFGHKSECVFDKEFCEKYRDLLNGLEINKYCA